MQTGGGSSGSSLSLAGERNAPIWLWALIGLGAIQLLLVCIHLLALGQSPDRADPSLLRQLFDFNQEGSIPTLWSAAVMLGTGIAGARVARCRAGREQLLWWLFAAAFAWLALEEQLLHLHEDSQLLTGVDWPLIYLPALIAGALLLRALAADAGGTGSSLIIAGVIVMAAGVGLAGGGALVAGGSRPPRAGRRAAC